MQVAYLLASLVVVTSFICMPRVTAWTLYSDPKTVDPANTTKVEIVCNKSHSETSFAFKNVLIIRITKVDSDGVSQTLASIDYSIDTATSEDVNFKANGFDGGLSIETTNVTYAVGKYGCVIIGVDKLGQVLQRSLPPVSIEEKEETNVDVLVRLRATERKVSGIEDTIRDLANAVGEISTKLDTILYENVNETQKKVPVTKRPPATSWPMGNYTLYEPQSGCPTDAWRQKFIRFQTNSGSTSRNNASSDNHFRSELFTRRNNINFVNLRYCFHPDDTNSVTWPSGSYCVNRASGECPSGFNYGFVKLALYDGNNWFRQSDPKLDVKQETYVLYLYFCCRDDAYPALPMSLPVDKPFYLYRFGGTCQEVVGMTARQEFMTIHTTEYAYVANIKDDISYYYSPDALLAPVTLHLCYYSKNKM